MTRASQPSVSPMRWIHGEWVTVPTSMLDTEYTPNGKLSPAVILTVELSAGRSCPGRVICHEERRAMLANLVKSWTVPQGHTTASHRRNVAQP